MSNQRARGLGSAIAVVTAAIPAFAAFVLVFLAVVLLALAVVFFVVAVLAAAFLITEPAALALTVLPGFGVDSATLSMLAAPAVGSNVQAQAPLMSAQACPVFATPKASDTSKMFPDGSNNWTAEPLLGKARLVSTEKKAMYAPGAIDTSPMA